MTGTNQIADQMPPDCEGAREIGFSIPTNYNASRILFDNLGRGLRLRQFHHPSVFGRRGKTGTGKIDRQALLKV
jgi:hypothetical protein